MEKTFGNHSEQAVGPEARSKPIVYSAFAFSSVSCPRDDADLECIYGDLVAPANILRFLTKQKGVESAASGSRGDESRKQLSLSLPRGVGISGWSPFRVTVTDFLPPSIPERDGMDYYSREEY